MQRKSVLDGKRFLELLLFSERDTKLQSLEDIALDFSQYYGTHISKQAIQERFNDSAVHFLSSVLQQQLGHKATAILNAENAYRFDKILIKDSTRFKLPQKFSEDFKGHGGFGVDSQISIQFEYDLIAGGVADLNITPANRNDQKDSKETLDRIEPNCLYIRDLAYVSQEYIDRIGQNHSYYVNRLNTRWTVLDTDKKPLDYSKIQEKLDKKGFRWIEIDVLIEKGKKLLPSRLILEQVSEKTYRERITKAERAARSKGYSLSDDYRAKTRLNMIITNIPKEWANSEQVRKAYSLRWQIELIFKTWKSQMKLNRVKPVKIQRFKCQLIAKMIWIMINRRFLSAIEYLSEKGEKPIKLSEWKFFKTVMRLSNEIRKAVFYSENLETWLQNLFETAKKKCRAETKKGKNNHLEILNIFLA
ncbi:IS4 family transposase [Aquiflexum sp. TKW24L]|nr:IS4 family transposase [Aquiflexum sp. TKW24L]